MPRIDHIAVWTDDIQRLAAFYANYFGAVAGPAYANPAKGFESCFVRFTDGVRIELMRTTKLAPQPAPPASQRMGWTHLAIAVGSEDEVNALTEQLRQAGYPVIDGPRRTGDGYYESVVLDPDGNRVEITV